MKKTTYIQPSTTKLDLYKRERVITHNDIINLSLIALRKNYVTTMEKSERLKIFIEEFKKKMKTKPVKNITSVINYWLSGLD